jgi:hypothetical protein
MSNQSVNFLGGLLQGFAGAKERSKLADEEKKERQLKTKLFEIQLQREARAMKAEEQQTGARNQLFDKLQGVERMPGTGVGVMDPTAKAPSLTELLADPQSAMMLLQSGMVKGDDMLKQQQSVANREMLAKFMGGGAGGGMELQGVKVGGEGQVMPDFGLPQVTSPQTVMGPNGPELATFNPRTGDRTATLGTPKPDTVAPETAGRISGLVQASEIAGQIKTQFIKEDGSIDRKLVMTSFANAPGTQGRNVRNDIGLAVDAVLRARTGAGVNVTEQKQVVEQFLPSPLDDDATIMNKMQRLDQFIAGTLDIATLPPAVRKRLEKAQGEGGGKVIDFNSLPK